MQKFSTWMILSLAVVFWLLRLLVAYNGAMGYEFMVAPLNVVTEIILLFVALVCFIFIAKRKWFGAIIYLVAYGGYFGVDLVKFVLAGAQAQPDYYTLLFDFCGILLPLFVFFDLAFDANRKAHPHDKKTDWFYTNKKYERQMDSRADKNNYRTM